jgi:pimeloyl-ACP methyl ester carboxylesterase
MFVLLLFYAGGGWYFAGQINSTALEVSHDEPARSLEIVSSTNGTVTLRENDTDVPALDSASSYGLSWDGGYGQVSGEPVEGGAEDGTGVTRRFKLLDGVAPPDGDAAALIRDAFPEDDPAAATDRAVREVEYTSPVGTFPAWFLPGRGSTWVVLTHGGLGTTRAEALRVMKTTAELRLPSLAITYRNDEGVPADPSGQWRYGRTEWEDLEGAVRYALDHGADDVVLVGYSMGAAITASFLERSPLAEEVSRVVLDSPMLDFERTVDYGASQRKLPLLGELPGSLTWVAKQIAAVRYDVDWESIDYLDNTAWVQVPTLVIHGDDDTRVPLSTSETLASEHPDLVTLEIVPGAAHVEAWNVAPASYDEALRGFLSQAD